MLGRSVVACAFAGFVVVAVACNKGSGSDGSGGSAATATTSAAAATSGGSKPAPATSSATTPVKYSKVPSKGTHPATQTAKKGGAGGTQVSGTSLTISEKSTDREFRKEAKAGTIDCSAGNMDNKAECDQNDLYYCDDSRLWVVDCDKEAKNGGADNGSCFEGEKFIDCLGCAKADDGTNVCCDFQMTVCCTDDGNCFKP
jgi:hypothetical protein